MYGRSLWDHFFFQNLFLLGGCIVSLLIEKELFLPDDPLATKLRVRAHLYGDSHGHCQTRLLYLPLLQDPEEDKNGQIMWIRRHFNWKGDKQANPKLIGC